MGFPPQGASLTVVQISVIPDVNVATMPDVNVATMPDVNVATMPDLIPRPTGGVKEKGSITTGVDYATVASRTVTDAMQFQLSKLSISVEKAAWVKWRWDAVDISGERLLDDKTILIEHFPYDYHDMLGDGSKAFDVQAKYETEAGLVKVEIVGEEE